MVEGDLLDLTLPSLLQALTRERSSAVLRLQRGTEDGGADQGAVYFSEGVLIHALANSAVGDDAMYELLGWSSGRFRLVRDPDLPPRTITPGLASVITSDSRSTGDAAASASGDANADERLLHDLLTRLSRLEQDKVRLEEHDVEPGPVPALLLLATVVNSMIAIVTARCSDPDLQPSRVLPRLAESQPYTQLLGEENGRISVATAAGVLKTWNSSPADRRQLFLDLSQALLVVLAFYGSTAGTFFHESREREEWRATFGVFVDGLSTALRQVDVTAAE
ncbi:MAG TPA: DUF4388 domain-containing protein [Vicinamibacterales bacterium]|nr:DUF4388 domain-containing protein [Vicinamibacterales bacterium]